MSTEARNNDSSVITEKLDKEIDKAINSELKTESATEVQDNSVIPEEENTIEPFIEQQKSISVEAENAAKNWLKTRETLKEIQERDDYLEQQRKNNLKTMVNRESNTDHKPEVKPELEAETFSNEEHKPIVPEHIKDRFIEKDNKYYFNDKPEALAFIDKGSKIQTKLSTANVAASMVDIAEARGWTEIEVKGTEDFKRSAWAQAAARGMSVKGYTPTEEDLARLKKVSDKRQINEIEAREQADTVATRKETAPVKNEKTLAPEQAFSTQEKSTVSAQLSTEEQKQDTKANKKEAPEKVNRLEGVLLDHGNAPYEHKEGNKESYYVTLQNADGKEHTTWGVDLERAVTESQIEKGDKVSLENLGRQPVTITQDIKDDKGNVIDTKEINTHRNKWQVKADAIRDENRNIKEVAKEHPDLVNELTAIKVAEKFSQQLSNESDREKFVSQVREKLASNLEEGKRINNIEIAQPSPRAIEMMKEAGKYEKSKAQELER